MIAFDFFARQNSVYIGISSLHCHPKYTVIDIDIAYYFEKCVVSFIRIFLQCNISTVDVLHESFNINVHDLH